MSGFATVEPRTTTTPRYEGTVVCKHCHAEFCPETRWAYGFYEEGTSGEFTTVGWVQSGHCPVCHREVKK